MKNFKNFIKEAHLGNPLNENKYLSNKDSYIKISEPSFRKDKNNPNFLSAYIKYDTGPGVGMALGKETMAGQIRRLSSAEALRQMEIIGRKLNDSYDLEDLDINDLENGVVELFAVSDDFIDMDPRSELSMAMLNETAGTFGDVLDDLENEDKLPDGFHSKEDLDQFIKDNPFDSERYRKLSIAQKQDILSYLNRDTEKEFERRMAMREESKKYFGVFQKGGSIGQGKDEPLHSFVDKEEANQKAKRLRQTLTPGEKSYYRMGYIVRPTNVAPESLKEEFSSTEEKMVNQIKSYKKRGSDMINLPFKTREFYFKNKEEIDALIEKEKWPKTLPSRYSDEYRFELEKVTPTYKDKPGRAKYRVIDIESGELKGTPVFGKPESLMAFADDLIKKQGGTQSTNLGEDINDPVLMKTRAAQMKRDAIEKKDLENKSKRISAEKAIDLRYELDILSKERENILMRIEDLGFETDQTAEPEGGKKADDVGRRMEIAIKDLRAIDSKIIDIKDDLGIFDMNESVNEAEIPLWLTDNREFEKRAYGILGPKYFKLLLSQSPGVLKDYYDSIRVTRPNLEEDDELNVNVDNANDNYAKAIDAESRSGAYESLQESLRKKLQERLK